MEKLVIYLVSDSVGETAQKVMSAVTAQFPTLNPISFQRFPFIENQESLIEILVAALHEKAIVVTTLVDKQLVQTVEEFAQKTGLAYVDYMTPLIQLIFSKTGIAPLEQPGTLHALNQDYFNKVAAIEFAVKYDDGKDSRGFLKADYVILGVSRTSKTPLSMYLANRSYRVANLPLIPEVPIPSELFQVKAEKVIGLTAGVDHLLKIRKNRLNALGLLAGSSYTDRRRIQEELAYANQIYQKIGARVINIENKAIEETAALIEQGQ